MKPIKAQKIYQQGCTVAMGGDHAKALKLFNQVSRFYSADFSYNLDFLKVAFEAPRYSLAHKILKRLRGLKPRKEQEAEDAGKLAVLLHDPKAAEKFFGQLKQMNPEKGCEFLSRVYERTHRLDQAAEVWHSFAGAAESPQARLMEAKLLRRQGEFKRALDLLQAEPVPSDADPNLHMEYDYEVAHVFDALGDYEKSYHHLLQAKTLIAQNPRLGNLRQALKKSKDNQQALVASISKELYEGWMELSESMETSRVAMVTGHPRSGTTLIERLIDRHPDLATVEESNVFVQTVRELFQPLVKDSVTGRVGFESEKLADVLRSSRKGLTRLYEDNLRHFYPMPIKEKMVVDRHPMNLPYLPVLHAMIPNAPVVVIIRDPRDVCLSFFMQYLALNEVSASLVTLEETAKQYMSHMEMWLKLRTFGLPQFLEIKYEEFVTDPEREYQRVLQHFQMKKQIIDTSSVGLSQQRLIMTPSYEAVIKPIHRGAVSRWKNYQDYFSKTEEILAPAIEAFGYV